MTSHKLKTLISKSELEIITGTLVTIISVVVLVGWQFNITSFKTLFIDFFQSIGTNILFF